MASKIKLGSRPKSFKRIVKFPLLEGGEGAIECNYKYRTRTEFGIFIDQMVAAAEAVGVKKEAEGGAEKFSMTDLMERTAGQNADYILDVLDGWNLDEDLNKVTVQQLADEIPAAAIAIMDSYRTAITEGRLGN